MLCLTTFFIEVIFTPHEINQFDVSVCMLGNPPPAHVHARSLSLSLLLTKKKMKCTIQWHLAHTQCFVTPHPLYLPPKHFHHPKGKPVPNEQFMPLFSALSSPWQPPFCFMSLWIYPSWVLHVNSIIQYASFCDWLLLFNVM